MSDGGRRPAGRRQGQLDGSSGAPFGPGEQATVAGHICLDVIPEFTGPARLEPGTLNEVGPVHFSTGGAVANVGLALDRLGVAVRLIGRTGDDPYGRVLEELLRKRDVGPELQLEKASDESTSYSVVISPPGVDRLFLHHPGCNDGFDPDRVDRAALQGSRILYFGYPPAMRKTYEDGGEALARLFANARAAGLITVLDMAMPDPLAASGRIDWKAYLAHVLPYVDVFMPSVEEIRFMLESGSGSGEGAAPPDGPGTSDAAAAEQAGSVVSWDLLASLTDRLLDLGAAVAVLKLGEDGLYLRTGSDERLEAVVGAGSRAWRQRTVWSPAFEVDVVGTTGAGDATVGGFIAGLLADLGPEECLATAAAVGACSVEAADASSAVLTWRETRDRMREGWARRPGTRPPNGWRQHERSGSYLGPGDGA